MSAAKLPSAAAVSDGPEAAARSSRRLLLIAAALSLSGVALLALYVHRYEVETSGGERVRLLTIVRAIPRGTVLTDELLGVREVPVSYVEARAIKATERSKVRGLHTSLALDPQDSLLWSDLALDVEDRDLSSLVQPGNRALTVEARQDSLIQPGDYVDVLASFASRSGQDYAGTTVVLLQRVLVLAVGHETRRQSFAPSGDKARGAAPSTRDLTLSVELAEAQMLALAGKNGELSVALRGGSDPAVQDGLPDLTTHNLLDQAARANAKRAKRLAFDRLPVRIDPAGAP